MTDAEKVELLRGAIERADKVLDHIFACPMKYPESTLTTASRVRKILDAAMRKTEPQQNTNAAKTKLPKVKLDIPAMMASGTLTEARR